MSETETRKPKTKRVTDDVFDKGYVLGFKAGKDLYEVSAELEMLPNTVSQRAARIRNEIDSRYPLLPGGNGIKKLGPTREEQRIERVSALDELLADIDDQQTEE